MDDKQKLHETNRYQAAFFPFEIYEVEKYKMSPTGRGVDNLHWHEEIQFTLALKGGLILQINGEELFLREGEGVFINSGILHTIKQMEEDGKYSSINFETRFLSFFLGSQMEQKYVFPYLNDYWLPAVVLKKESFWQAEILKLLVKLRIAYKDRQLPALEYQIAIWLVEIWYELITHVDPATDVNVHALKQKQTRMQDLLLFVHQNYERTLTLQEIATAAHISTAECTRCFKEFTGNSPYEYVLQYRINSAATLIQTTSFSIEQIAEKVGFHSTSSFIQTFKKRMGLTPLKYRKVQAISL